MMSNYKHSRQRVSAWHFTMVITFAVYVLPACSNPTSNPTTDGPSPAVALVSGQDGPYGIAVDGKSVYWSNRGKGNSAMDGAIRKLTIGESSPINLATLRQASKVAIDASSLYWADFNSPYGADAYADLFKLALGAGGMPVEAGPDEGTAGVGASIAVNASSVYWIEGVALMMTPVGGGSTKSINDFNDDFNDAPQDLAADDTAVYWTTGDRIRARQVNSDKPMTLASHSSPFVFFGHVAVYANSVFWTEIDYGVNPGSITQGSLKRMATDGNSPTTLASVSAGDMPGIFAVDDSGAYWFTECTRNDDCTRRLMKVALVGGVPVALASGVYHPTAIALDASYVYWTDWSSGSTGNVMMVAK